MRKTLRIGKNKVLIYSPQHRGYYDPEDIGRGTIYRFKKPRNRGRTRRAMKKRTK